MQSASTFSGAPSLIRSLGPAVKRIGQRDLSIWSLNVRSVVKHYQEIYDLLADGSPDVLFLTETWLQDSDSSITNLAFPPEYAIFTLNRTTRGGGIAMVTKRCYPCQWKAAELLGCEGALFKIAFSHQFTFSGLLIYRPPGCDSVFRATLPEYISIEALGCANFNVVGDLNLHLDCPSLPTIRSFLADLEALQLSQMITFPTHKGGHILDPFFTNLEGLRVLGSSQLVWTDHMLVKMACSLSDSPFVSQDRFVLKRHWNKLSLEDFYHQLEKAPLGPLTEVDCGYDSFCEWISGALDSLIPMCWSKCHRKEPSPWYDTSLASLKRVCRQAERLWRKSYDSDLKICYLAKIKIYHRAVCQTRASFYAQQFQKSTNPSKLIFKVLKDLMAKRVIAGEICSDSHCEGLASFFHEKVQAIYRTFPTGSLMLEQVGRTLVVTSSIGPRERATSYAPFKCISDVRLYTTVQCGSTPTYYSQALEEKTRVGSGDPITGTYNYGQTQNPNEAMSARAAEFHRQWKNRYCLRLLVHPGPGPATQAVRTSIVFQCLAANRCSVHLGLTRT
ncbi:hypothetical protein NDU88_002937 [Pleurodeles waltl]|uniref:Endonuclease/exonuclease/phosphatase domain-containing protein n=1 Tax=Pleurodeles waltl TaxID=8319 RepID=A0AAV7UAP1_PLEWA|nr:hypothetical protein NDU88_002937 [Pleurodeles waltl]